MSKHKTIAEWQFLVDQFLQSNQSMDEFCNQNNVNLRTFENRYYELRPKKNLSCSNIDNVTNNPTFVKITLPSYEPITIKLPNGIILELAYKNLSAVIKELANAI